jgi:bacterioferritin (cytochrome b1)
MQPTTLGPNLTGASLAPAAVVAMTEATDEYTPFDEIDVSEMETQKLAYIGEADAVGSVPVPATMKGKVKSGLAKLKGGQPGVFLDKLGERLAYERTGARLYEALILKFEAARQAEGDVLPPVSLIDAEGSPREAEEAEAALQRIHNEELEHFQLLTEAIVAMGGDPTSQTPCADVTALASSGFMQVLNDPRTTLAQCLNAMLAVELADNAGWELLAALADDAGESDLAGQFLGALAQEQEHLLIVKQWLTALVVEDPKPAVI